MAFDPKGKQTFHIRTPELQVQDYAAASHTVFYAARLLEGVLGVAAPGLRPEADQPLTARPPARSCLFLGPPSAGRDGRAQGHSCPP